MLDKVAAPELIAAAVESCILPYTEEHQIPFDELLLQYIKVKFHHCITSIYFSKCLLISVSHSVRVIPSNLPKDLLERCSSQTTTLFTEWEAKAVAVLGCMTDTDVSSRGLSKQCGYLTCIRCLIDVCKYLFFFLVGLVNSHFVVFPIS